MIKENRRRHRFAFRHVLVFAAFFAMAAGGALAQDKLGHIVPPGERTAATEKISLSLLALQQARTNPDRAADPAVRAAAEGLVVRGKEKGAVELDVRLSALTAAAKADLAAVPTATIVNIVKRYNQATVRLGDLSHLGAIAAIPEVERVLPEYGTTGEFRALAGVEVSGASTPTPPNAGSVQSRGVFAHNVDGLLLQDNSLTGAGQRVGVISDSVARTPLVRDGDTTPPPATAGSLMNSNPQESGDLPSVVQILADDHDLATNTNFDRGAAMLETVHDIAPDAALSFHTGEISKADFAQGIADLQSAGATVIADDVQFFTEPVYQPGIVSQAALAATNSGVAYYAAAGNLRNRGFRRDYVDSNRSADDELFPSPSGDDFHNFGGGDRFMDIGLGPGAAFLISLQWNQPFQGMGLGSGSEIDMDLYLFDAPNPSATILASSTDNQGFTNNPMGDPVEILAFQNSSSSGRTVYLAIDHFRGNQGDIPQAPPSQPTDLQFSLILHAPPTDLTIEYLAGSTMFGHTVGPGATSIAAVPWYDTPRYDPTFQQTSLTDPAFNTSLGGILPHFFDGSGNFSLLFHAAPDLSAVSETNTSFFGTDLNTISGFQGEPDGHPNFFGTAPAASHAAGIVALLRQAAPGMNLDVLEARIGVTAFDVEGLFAGPGFDEATGSGLIDAGLALDALDGFVHSDLGRATVTGPGPFPAQASQNEWVFRDWTDQVGTGGRQRWLLDNRGAASTNTSTGASTLIIDGDTSDSSNPESAFDPDTAFGVWDNFADPFAEISPGLLLLVRAGASWDPASSNTGSGQFESTDAFRIFANAPPAGQGNGTAGFSVTNNMSLSGESMIDPDNDGVETPNPTFPASGATEEFLLKHDPLDSDFAQSGVQDNPTADIGMDFVNAVGGSGGANLLTVRMTKLELGAIPESIQNMNASQVTAFGGDPGEQRFDGSDTGGAWEGWGVVFRGSIFAGQSTGDEPSENLAPILADVNTLFVNAGTIGITTFDQNLASNPSAISFAEVSQYAFFQNSTSESSPPGIANDVNRVEVNENASYRFDFEQAVVAGSSEPNLKPMVVNQVGMPEPLNFRARSVITPHGANSGTAFSSNSARTIPLYHTWLEQLPPGTVTGDAAGAENDAQLVGGTLDFFGTDGTIFYESIRVNLLSNDDPNIDY